MRHPHDFSHDTPNGLECVDCGLLEWQFDQDEEFRAEMADGRRS